MGSTGLGLHILWCAEIVPKSTVRWETSASEDWC